MGQPDLLINRAEVAEALSVPLTGTPPAWSVEPVIHYNKQ